MPASRDACSARRRTRVAEARLAPPRNAVRSFFGVSMSSAFLNATPWAANIPACSQAVKKPAFCLAGERGLRHKTRSFARPVQNGYNQPVDFP
jgi:hypothetical protein